MAKADIAALIQELRPILGGDGVLTGEAVSARAAGIWRPDTVAAPVIFRPVDTAQVSAILGACHAAGQSVVIHGGLTGLAGGAIAGTEDVVLSTERMIRIEHVDVVNRTMRLQSGVRLQHAQEAAEHEGLLLSLDLGARGSCTVGGNAATNAGGNNVLRYGMAREQILGVEAVMADGTVVSSLNEMIKNNAGYDLKQLFIGTEGTLGVITRLVFRLRPLCETRDTALLACHDFSQVTRLFAELDTALEGNCSAFEVMWQDFYALAVVAEQPLATDYPYYVLVESEGHDAHGDSERFLRAIEKAMMAGYADDGVIAKSERERAALWGVRENVERTLEHGPAIIFDVGLPLSAMEKYVADVKTKLTAEWHDDYQVWVFGHAGDGNLHLVVAAGDGGETARQRIEHCVYSPLEAIGGSISAEHGIGIEKRDWLPVSRTQEEIALMHILKSSLDPKRILNPGRVFSAEKPR